MQGLALMARPRRGTLKRRPTKQGISYGVAFTHRGEEFYEHFGGEWEGWDEQRAAEEQRFLIEKVNRGEWTPAKAEPARGLAAAASPSFQVGASQWLHRRKVRAGDLEGRSETMRDLEWRLSVVMDKFGPAPIDELDFGLADELVIELCEERAAIERAAAEGVPLMRAVRDSRIGTSYQARRRGVSNGSIRKVLDAAERVLRDAKKRGVLVGEVPALKSAAPKAERPRRSFLEAEQIAAVLRAADLIEAEHRGLTWERVDLIRSSSRSAVSLARELGVSDTLIRKVRRGELWNAARCTEPQRRPAPRCHRHADLRRPARLGARRARWPAPRRCGWPPSRTEIGNEVRCRQAQRPDRAGAAPRPDRATDGISERPGRAGVPDAQRYAAAPGQRPCAHSLSDP